MIIRKQLFFDSTLKELENKNNFFVHFPHSNGLVRNKDGETIGEVSSHLSDKLIKSGKLKSVGSGSGLLSHEKYYKLK